MKLKYYCLCVLALSLLGCDEFFKKDSKKDYNKNKAPRVNVPSPKPYTPSPYTPSGRYNNTDLFPSTDLNAWSIGNFTDDFGDKLEKKFLKYNYLSTSNNAAVSEQMGLLITKSDIEFRFQRPYNAYQYSALDKWQVRIKYKDGSTRKKDLKTYERALKLTSTSTVNKIIKELEKGNAVKLLIENKNDYLLDRHYKFTVDQFSGFSQISQVR